MPEPRSRSRSRLRTLVLSLLVALPALAGIALLPGWLVTLDLNGRSITPAQRLSAINEVRITLVQVVGGVVVAIGGWATWRRLRINEEELRATRDGQITDRYSRAIEHLGSDNMDVRMGGIYALERIAGNSPTDRDTILAVLCAYVRGHAPWPPSAPGQLPADVALEQTPSLAMRANDVQAAVWALGRMPAGPGGETVVIPRTDLRHARMEGLDFHLASVGHANMCRARLRGTTLREAAIVETDLRHADLREADLRDALLLRADLRGANLRRAKLAGARLVGARADAGTRWPDRFDPTAAGVVVEPAQ